MFWWHIYKIVNKVYNNVHLHKIPVLVTNIALYFGRNLPCILAEICPVFWPKFALYFGRNLPSIGHFNVGQNFSKSKIFVSMRKFLCLGIVASQLMVTLLHWSHGNPEGTIKHNHTHIDTNLYCQTLYSPFTGDVEFSVAINSNNAQNRPIARQSTQNRPPLTRLSPEHIITSKKPVINRCVITV